MKIVTVAINGWIDFYICCLASRRLQPKFILTFHLKARFQCCCERVVNVEAPGLGRKKTHELTCRFTLNLRLGILKSTRFFRSQIVCVPINEQSTKSNFHKTSENKSVDNSASIAKIARPYKTFAELTKRKTPLRLCRFIATILFCAAAFCTAPQLCRRRD